MAVTTLSYYFLLDKDIKFVNVSSEQMGAWFYYMTIFLTNPGVFLKKNMHSEHI